MPKGIANAEGDVLVARSLRPLGFSCALPCRDSLDINFWHGWKVILRPVHPWKFKQIGRTSSEYGAGPQDDEGPIRQSKLAHKSFKEVLK